MNQIRGLHLDLARRPLTLQKILEIIHEMSKCNMNTLHLHLTDDQGIAIDINSLSFIGVGLSIKEQDEILKLCEFYNIQIIPEIDIPGHSVALRCLLDGKSYKPETRMGIKTEGLISLDHIPKLIEIFEELCERFKVKNYFHIGCDETRGGKKPYFKELVNTICKWGKDRGLQIICWEDILSKLDDEFPENLIIHRWKVRTFVQRSLDILGPKRIIYSHEYYLDKSPDLYTAYRKKLTPDACGYIACCWGELIGMENIDQTVYPAIYLLGYRWSIDNNTVAEVNPVLYLYKNKNYIKFPIIRTWKRKQWTGFTKESAEKEPRSTGSVTTETVLDRRHDSYPVLSSILVDISWYLYFRLTGEDIPEMAEDLVDVFYAAGASDKNVQKLLTEKSPSKLKTILRSIQIESKAEEQLYCKNGLRMVIREALRI